MKLATSILVFSLVLTGCYYDKEEALYGQPVPCESGTVTYSPTITGMLTSYGCLGCHAGTNPSGNVNLQGYAGVKAVADNGKLLGVISHSTGFSPMPMGGNKMAACDINKIKAWVEGGALNN